MDQTVVHRSTARFYLCEPFIADFLVSGENIRRQRRGAVVRHSNRLLERLDRDDRQNWAEDFLLSAHHHTQGDWSISLHNIALVLQLINPLTARPRVAFHLLIFWHIIVMYVEKKITVRFMCPSEAASQNDQR